MEREKEEERQNPEAGWEDRGVTGKSAHTVIRLERNEGGERRDERRSTSRRVVSETCSTACDLASEHGGSEGKQGEKRGEESSVPGVSVGMGLKSQSESRGAAAEPCFSEKVIGPK